MIVEELKNWRAVFRGKTWKTVFTALEALGPDTPEGETRLDGDDIILRVMSYATRRPWDESAVLEAHREYIDIQVSLQGAERIDWFPLEELTEKAPYNPDSDAVFFYRPGAGRTPAPAHVDNVPGRFTVLFPTDAHMPQMSVEGEPCMVKKAVVKLRASRVRSTGTA